MTRALIICLAILFACLCNAQGQEHTAKIVEVLPDGSYIVEIQGAEFRAISGEKAVELAKQKIDLKECRDNEGNYKQIISLAAKDITIANQKAEIERGNFVRAMQMYTTERELRQEASQFGQVSGTSKGFGGWLLKAVNSNYGAVAFKLAIPTATFIKTIRQ